MLLEDKVWRVDVRVVVQERLADEAKYAGVSPGQKIAGRDCCAWPGGLPLLGGLPHQISLPVE